MAEQQFERGQVPRHRRIVLRDEFSPPFLSCFIAEALELIDELGLDKVEPLERKVLAICLHIELGDLLVRCILQQQPAAPGRR